MELENLELNGLTCEKEVFDKDSNQTVEVEDWMKLALVLSENAILKLKIMEAATIWLIKEYKLYLAIDGINSFSDYCESSRCRIGKTHAYNYIRLFDRLKPFIPSLKYRKEVVHTCALSNKNSLSEAVRRIRTDDLRNLWEVEEDVKEKQTAWGIINNTSPSALIQLTNCPEIDLAPIQYGAGIDMPDGSILMSRDLPKTTVSEVRKRLKPKPQINIGPDLVRVHKEDPEKKLKGIIDNANRLASQLRSEVSRIKTEEHIYISFKKEIKQIFYQVEQLQKYGLNESNFIQEKVQEQKLAVNNEMVPVKKVAGVLGVSQTYVNKISKNMPPDSVQVTSGPSGKTKLINPEFLPEEYALKWKAYKAPEDVMSREERDAMVWAQSTESQREHAAPYLELIKLTKGLKGKELKAAINKYNAQHPNQDDINIKSFYRQKAEYKKHGLEGIIPDWGKNAGKTKVHPDDIEYFASLYMTQNKMSANYCYEQTLAKASRDGRIDVRDKEYWEIDLDTGEVFQKYPVSSTVLSAVVAEKGEDKIELAREGEYKFKKSSADYHIGRDLSEHNAGEIWVSDHRQIDVLCISDERQIYQAAKKVLHEKLTETDKQELKKKVRNLLAGNIKNNKPFRPWLTAWIDMKTGKWISWSLHSDNPNSSHIKQTLKWGIEKYGIPKYVYIDNGKDYRSKSFAGNRTHHKLEFDENEIKPLCYQLGIKPVFAKPYNARAKMIERAFRYLIEKYEKAFPTYTGKNASERPATTTKNIKKGIIPDFNDVVEDFDKLFNLINREPREGKELMGMSPDQLWSESWKLRKPISSRALKMFCMEFSKPKQLVANGYLDPHLGRYYYADWMAGMYKRRVILMRDPDKWEEAWVLDAETKELIGDRPADLIAGTDGMAESPEDNEQLQHQLKIQAQRRNIIKADLKGLKKVANGEVLENYEEIVNLKLKISDFTYSETDNTVVPMPDRNNQLDQLADQISKTQLQKHKKENLDLSKITPKSKSKSEKKTFKSILD